MCKYLRVLPAFLFVFALLVTRSLIAEDLPTDPKLVTGELDNGMRYIVEYHNNPKGRAVIWLHMHTGSLNETDSQRGIAHYTEHMAFNGSKNFPPGKLVPFFESLGMTFGRDQNAFTSYDQTTYQLTLPNAEGETLGKGMTFFADVLSRLLLLPTEIDNERQIILEERRRGLGGRQRTRDYIQEHAYPGSLFGFREPIGTDTIIKAVNEKDFHDYYGKWYCPSNATLMVIADAEPDFVVKVIKQQFADEPNKPRPEPQKITVKPYDHDFAVIATDPEIRSAEVTISRIEPAHPPTTTYEQYVNDLTLSIGEQAMNHRLNEKASDNKQPYLRANVSAGDEVRVMHSADVRASAKPANWKPALEAVALELQRAREFGFTQKEVDRVTKDLISNAERSVEMESSNVAASMMQRLNSELASGDTIMSPEQHLELLKRALPTIKLDAIKSRFANEFNPTAVAFIATMPSGKDVPTEAELVEVGRKALDVKPTPEAEKSETIAALMTTPPAPGTIAQQDVNDPTGVWSGWLSNNVLVHYKFNDARKDEASISIALIGGTMLETADNRGITSAAELAWSRPTTDHLTSAEIREFMTGRKVSVRGGGGGFGGGRGGGRRGGGGGGAASGDSISLNVSGRPDEFDTGMQLAYLLLTEPKIESAAFDQWQTSTRENLSEEVRSPMQLGQRLMSQAMYPKNEVRLRPVTAEQLDHLSVASAQAWLNKLIKESPIEVTIVGDIQKDKMIELVTKYLAALPTRPKVDPTMFADLRKIARPEGSHTIEKDVPTQTNQAFVLSGFYGADESNRPDAMALSMASRILSMRMNTEIREDAQLVYSIGASSRLATTYPGFGLFSAAAPTDPEKVPALVAKLTSMYEKFAKDGPTDDEVTVAKKQFATDWPEAIKQPQFWTATLNQITFRGRDLDDLMRQPQQYDALTAQQVRDVFAKYYSKDNAVVIVAKPKEGAGGDASKTANTDSGDNSTGDDHAPRGK